MPHKLLSLSGAIKVNPTFFPSNSVQTTCQNSKRLAPMCRPKLGQPLPRVKSRLATLCLFCYSSWFFRGAHRFHMDLGWCCTENENFSIPQGEPNGPSCVIIWSCLLKFAFWWVSLFQKLFYWSFESIYLLIVNYISILPPIAQAISNQVDAQEPTEYSSEFICKI